MKVIKLNGAIPKLVDLDYNLIKEEMENYEKKGKFEKSAILSKLINNLEKSATSEEIENEVNNIIDTDREKVKELKKEIKALEKEISLLSQISNKEVESDVFFTIVANL